MKYLKLSVLLLSIITSMFIFTSCNNASDKVTTEKTTEPITTTSSPSSDTSGGELKGTLARDEIYSCKMHNEVMSDHPGKCPKCGMTLVKMKMTDKQKQMMKDNSYIKPKN